jgi:hypothetical protein
MAMADNLLFLDDARGEGDATARKSNLGELADRRRHVAEGHHGRQPGMAEAAELIAALGALVDAGLVVVQDEADGPARYRIGDGLGGVA